MQHEKIFYTANEVIKLAKLPSEGSEERLRYLNNAATLFERVASRHDAT